MQILLMNVVLIMNYVAFVSLNLLSIQSAEKKNIHNFNKMFIFTSCIYILMKSLFLYFFQKEKYISSGGHCFPETPVVPLILDSKFPIDCAIP